MTKVIGHRGAPRQARENTLDAFRAAASAGADMVELDVRRTADGKLVVHHDAALDDGRLIVESAAADLPAWLPTLDAAFDACPDIDINVEIKNWPADPDFDPSDGVAGAVAELIVHRDLHDRVIVSSFNLRTIAAVKAADRDIPTAWLTFPNIDALPTIATAAAAGHQAIHPYDATITLTLVEEAHRAPASLNAWTVDDLARIRQLVAWEVDGIVTNVPDVVVQALRA